MTDTGLSRFIVEPDPDNAGWMTWDLAGPRRFNAHAIGKLIARRENERAIRLRMFPEIHHTNVQNGVHGGVTLALIDVSLFACARLVSDADPAGSVTLDLSTHFIGAGRIGIPLDAITEVLRETRRMIFLRGIVEQEGELVASFGGTIRKPAQQ